MAELKKKRKRAKKTPPPVVQEVGVGDPPAIDGNALEASVIGWDPENHGAKRYNPSDPLGQVTLFQENGGGIPSLDSSVIAIYKYVDHKARSIGAHIPKNHGHPSFVPDHQMLSSEEKAIVLLGRAIGIPYRGSVDRINELRAAAGLDLYVLEASQALTPMVARHRDIVNAIQVDMLAAVEEWSPLVAGSQRFVWHARMIEIYRALIVALAEEPLDSIRRIDHKGKTFYLDKVNEIRRLDKAMSSHLTYMDKLVGSADLAKLLSNPSGALAEQRRSNVEDEIEAEFEEDKITEVERLQRLRQLRHGDA